MKSGLISIALVVTVLIGLLTFAQGLQCYYCQSINAPLAQGPRGQNQQQPQPAFHKGCDEGPLLPDSILQTCTLQNSFDFFQLWTPETHGSADVSVWEGNYGCAKVTTKGQGFVKGCILAPKVVCKNDGCLVVNTGTKVYDVCNCYEDKCNGAGGLSAHNFLTLFVTLAPFVGRF